MKNVITILTLFLFAGTSVFAQVGINADNSAPDPSAGLDVKFSNKGLLPPRMSHALMNAIVDPANGLIIYCTDCSDSGNGALAMFISGAWYMFAPMCISPFSPSAGTHVPAATQVTWNWNPVAGATGYKLGTTNNYPDAADMGGSTTFTETGLTCNNGYTRYAWSYNVCGNSAPVALDQATSACPVTCGSLFTDPRDNQVYTTVLIGSQCWMKQNLNIGTKINSILEQTNNSTIEKYCYYDVDEYCNTYGGLYQWNEMMQYENTAGAQGICPVGWHIPTHEEWCVVTQYLDPTVVCGIFGYNGTNAGGKMKSTGTIQAGTGLWHTPNAGATNESGFSAIPAGYRAYDDGSFNAIGYGGRWWSSPEYTTIYSLNWYMWNSDGLIYSDYFEKNNGVSVRCLQDL